MSTKFTPGPWLRDDRSGLECDVRAASGRKVALCWGLASNNARNYEKKYKAECDANATLIAAAPDLLEALQRLLSENDNMTQRINLLGAMDQARAAIAKATRDQS